MSITTFEIENFYFGSTNPVRVQTVKNLFTDGLTVESIKNNTIDNRHNLMINLACWGHCSLTNSYGLARDLRQKLYNDLIDSLPKYHSNRVLWCGPIGYGMVADQVFDLTGWRF